MTIAKKHALPGLLVACLLVVYLNSMAPGLSWANGGSDGGDLITAAATRGVAHPTGYPVYVWLAGFFQMLPVGTLAHRTNLFSVVAMTAAALCIYLTVERSAAIPDIFQRQIAGVVAGLAFGTSRLAWSQAVITEVYALHAFFVALIFYIVGDPEPAAPRCRKVFLIGLILGLALGNHVTMALLIPGIVGGVVFGNRQSVGHLDIPPYRDTRLIAKTIIWLALGLAVGLLNYLLLPWWASARPAVNWGNPVTLKNFIWLVTGELYQEHLFDLTQSSMLERMHVWAELLLQQFGIFGISLALMGAVVRVVPKRIFTVTMWTAITVSMFAIFYNVVDWYFHLIPVYLVFGVWLGLGLARIIATVSVRGWIARFILALVCTGYIASSTLANWSQVDASKDMRAEIFGRAAMRELPAHAIVFVEEDRTVFTLWYFHFALGERPDVTVIATDLLHFDWYQENLRSTYPSLEIPGPFPWPETIAGANPQRAICRVEHTDHTKLDCSIPSLAP